MQSMWGLGDNFGQGSGDAGAASGERVVPADGDPEVEQYRERLRLREEQARHRPLWLRALRLLVRGRSPRAWALTVLAIALVIVFIKPLLVLAAVMAAGVLGVLLFGLLVAGALLLATRFALTGHIIAPRGRWSLPRRWLRRNV